MKATKYLWAYLLIIASGSALAMDPDDEDASYLPQGMLQEFFSSSVKHGFDKTYFKNCIVENSAATKEKSELNKIADSCRLKATPRKCRELSAIPAHEKAKSSQELCAASCKTTPADEGCALN